MIIETYVCDRVDCDAATVLPIEEVEKTQVIPDGWGWDVHDEGGGAFHCPEHRIRPTEGQIAEAYNNPVTKDALLVYTSSPPRVEWIAREEAV